MKTALVILNWNGKPLLEKFLPVIVKYSYLPNVEIWVADNASTDDSVDFVKENFPGVKIVKNEVNGGFAKGYNEALKFINADIYGLINSDIEVTENWLNPILNTFKKEPETAIIQPKILDYKNKSKFEYAGAAGGFIDKFGYPFCRGRIFSTVENDNLQYNDEAEIFWASGACFFIRSSVFKELNGFDEHYFAHQEEVDLCWRAQNSHKKVKYIGKSRVFHVGGATLEEGSVQKTFLNFRNSLYSLVKNIPENKLTVILIIRLVLDGIAGLKFFLTLKPLHTLAIIKAHFNFYKNLKSILLKRKQLPKKSNYYKVKSIVWKYFIFKKKTYKEL